MWSSKTTLEADCGSDHELHIDKFRLKLKKVGKTTRPFRYDLNQILYDYTVAVTNRFKGLDLVDRVPEDLWTEAHNTVRESADYIIDTSVLATAMLREKIVDLLESDTDEGMLLHFISFGYKYGIPAEADLVFDVRCLPNPFYVDELKYLTGNDKEVQNYVMQSPDAEAFLVKLMEMLEFLLPGYVKEGKHQLVPC